ncbi:DotU family type IV/VI secretion system protein [Pseudomonas sp. NPDC089734]|uniref:DotU family type IV/VI secretion system protein n=1 Tax=Pseudomonas sp. NPDC089734 TaxID=3364469 RepID=UPI0037FABFEB
MPEGNAISRARVMQEAPLSSAFREAWQQWLSAWNEQDKSVEDTARLVETVAEFSTRITRKLWRNAFSSVGDSATQQMKAMVYAFVALVDETLLFAEWSGQGAWQEKPLESRLYSSRQAGQRVPLEIKRLLDEQVSTNRDLGNVYLLCLILGFHGHLRGERGQALHEKWRHALFTFTRQREPDYANVGQLLTEPSRVAPRQLPMRKSLPDGLRLGLVILAFTLLFIGVGQLFWRDIGQRLEPVLHLATPFVVAEQVS